MSNHDFGQSRITELEKEIALKNKIFEELVVTVFAISELRNLWRKKFGLPLTESPDDGNML